MKQFPCRLSDLCYEWSWCIYSYPPLSPSGLIQGSNQRGHFLQWQEMIPILHLYLHPHITGKFRNVNQNLVRFNSGTIRDP